MKVYELMLNTLLYVVLTGPQFLEFIFQTKNKLKFQIFNDKKSLSAKIFFSVTTKNLNLEILTKNIVTFKNGMRLRMKNFKIMGVNSKIQFLEGGGGGEGGYKKPIYRAEMSEKD